MQKQIIVLNIWTTCSEYNWLQRPQVKKWYETWYEKWYDTFHLSHF
jgi:hypothetical protein